jgi:hypothetical protein
MKTKAETEQKQALDAMERKWNEKFKAEEARAQKAEQELHKTTMTNGLREISNSTTPKMRQDRFELFARMYEGQFQLNPQTNEITLVDNDGMPSLKSVKFFIENEVLGKYPEWFEGNYASGSGAAPWNKTSAGKNGLEQELAKALKDNDMVTVIRLQREKALQQRAY